MIEAGVVDEGDYVVVGFHDTETGQVIELQYGEPDDQDVALGMTGVCVVVNGGAATAYEAVAQWSIEEELLTVELTEEAAATLGLDPVFQVDLHGLPDRGEVERALRRVLPA